MGLTVVSKAKNHKVKPYFVLEDVRLLLQKWSEHHSSNWVIPDNDFFTNLRREFTTQMRNIFPCFEMPGEDILCNEMKSLLSSNKHPIVSLGCAYCDSPDHIIDITRTVTRDKSKWKEADRRPRGGCSLSDQARRIASSLEEKKKVVLVDDVIFSGDSMLSVIDIFEDEGLEVCAIYATVGIKSGLQKIQKHKVQVQCAHEYTSVRGAVCERDFYPGVPYSGRLVLGKGNTGAPYLVEPFGDPVVWAKIPNYSHALELSRFCKQQTVALFSEIEKLSGINITCRELPRFVYSLPTGCEGFVNELSDATFR